MKALHYTTALLALSVSLGTAPVQADFSVKKEIKVCASKSVSAKVQKTYKSVVGAPLPVVSRMAKVPEVQVATGLPSENRLSILASSDIVKKLWKDIDAWGRDTMVRTVYTMGGDHVLDFPTKIPQTQADLDDGWLDIYADDGKGVHGHLWIDSIHSIHLVDIPGSDDVRTRTISFYSNDGKLLMGLYASITIKEFDQAAIDGFEKTRAFIAALPQICT